MKLILIGLAVLMFPLATMIAENSGSDRRDVKRMADRDRHRTHPQPIIKRMRYARTYKNPVLRQQHGKRPEGPWTNDMMSVARTGLFVN